MQQRQEPPIARRQTPRPRLRRCLWSVRGRARIRRANATIVEVPASHVSFVSQPDAATQLILQAVEATMSAAST
jgi:hypothetical protein